MKPLIFGNTHWEERKRCFSFPMLEKDLTTEVLIVGGGMSGTLCAHVLTDAGIRTSRWWKVVTWPQGAAEQTRDFFKCLVTPCSQSS